MGSGAITALAPKKGLFEVSEVSEVFPYPKEIQKWKSNFDLQSIKSQFPRLGEKPEKPQKPQNPIQPLAGYIRGPGGRVTPRSLA
jgi:hypothetical protein